MTIPPAVQLDDLTKTYGKGADSITALDSLDLTIDAGTVFGLLGANGSGKSTLVGVLSTLIEPTSGRAQVYGVDTTAHRAQVRRLIGVTGQQVALDERLSGRENLEVFSRLHGLARRVAAATADDLLGRYGLAAACDRPVRTYSGGMKRRLDIIASLVLEPALLFLDEPTTGLDPHSRNDIWTAVRDLSDRGTSVFLTTQYLDEADQLADRIGVLNAGRLIADGTPHSIKRRLGRRLSVSLDQPGRTDAALTLLGSLGVRELATANGAVSGLVDQGTLNIPAIVEQFTYHGIALADIGMREPTLDEAYLALTGERA